MQLLKIDSTPHGYVGMAHTFLHWLYQGLKISFLEKMFFQGV
jgi:hypothetical protein